MSPSVPLILVVILTIREGALEKFRRYEAEAARIMERHGGRIERAIFIPPEQPGLPAREVHIVSFESSAGFEAYRQDPALLALAPLRTEAIAETQLLKGAGQGA